jgi:hypothetical protein
MSIYETTPPVGHEFENLVFQDYFIEKLFDYTDLATSPYAIQFPLEAGIRVLGVSLQIDVAFTGTAPVLQVGDASAAAGYLATTDVDATAQYAFGSSEGIDASAYSLGKYYPSGGSIIVDCNEAPTAGAGRVFIHVLKNDRNWRLPAAS